MGKRKNKPVKLLDLLLTDVIADLPDLLAKPEVWASADVTQSTRMERLKTPWRDCQIFLQRFLPTTIHPWHGHPWPSVYLALSGEVEMGVVTWAGMHDEPPPDKVPAAVVHLTTGSKYEMLDPGGMHYVKCSSLEALGLMLTGPNWPGYFELDYEPLSEEKKAKLLSDFRFFF